MSTVALVIIYNHRYDKNIDVVESLYKNRFSNIFHIMPFYTGKKENVFPVYENSFYFQGYIAQAYKFFFKKEFTHYFFIADDLILNPIINETNYTGYLKLDADTCFIPTLGSLHHADGFWHRFPEALNYTVKVKGVEAEHELPSYEKAFQKFSSYGLEIKPLKFDQVYKRIASFKSAKNIKQKAYYVYYKLRKLKDKKKLFHLKYPLVGSYSDIFVVSSNTMELFCHYCGVFATTNLFVEIALPTAMVLSANKIVTENNLDVKGRPLWTPNDYSILDKYENDLEKLINGFPPQYLYLHPIKLSKWKKI